MKYIKSFKLYESVTDSEIESLFRPYAVKYNFEKSNSFYGFEDQRSYRFLDRHSSSQDSFLFVGFPVDDDISNVVDEFVNKISDMYQVSSERHVTDKSIFFVIKISEII